MRILSLLITALLLITSQLHSQALSSAELAFLKKNAVPIKQSAKVSAKQWEAVGEAVKNKRIVLLGEFNHGAREVFLVRNELIRYLHEQLDFDVILFEAGIGELIRADIERDQLSPAQMTYGFFGIWHTNEFRELMTYIQTEKIAIAGFDVQRSSGSFQHIISKIAPLAAIDINFCYDLETRYGNIKNQLANRKTEFASVNAATQALIKDYQKLSFDLQQAEQELSSRMIMMSLQTLHNRVAFLEFLLQFTKDKNWNRRWAARDSLMADNISWLAENIYPGQKLIVVGHNFHIANYNEKEEVMGEFLRRKYADEMYAIGAFGGRGSYANNGGKEEQMAPADTSQLDIKHVIAALKGEAYFMDIPDQPQKGDDWLRQTIVINDSFIDLSSSNRLILAKHFDAILLLQQVSPPKK